MQDDLDTVRDFFAQGGTLQALVNLDPADLDRVYAYACQLFDAGDYAGAKRFYLMLARLSHWQFDYWLSLGLCCQRLGEHTEAIFCFGQAGLLRLDDPRSAYLAGLSHQLIGNRPQAAKAFAAALKWCAARPEYAELKAEIQQQAASCPKEEHA
ncbi:SycD/LcrH family type III secretion system chaperone [Chromobacterium vaccinii]|uniref:SycD/LcrH family type III secretion system chaperone n=1 Tax=Chromobacterium vaccinii TaxID=1108595 RepID=UPI000E14C2DB|nr:SycD/LcrH family type III secretion system chaperone [Chromobacterium vaccinii]MCD4487165.1 SycD/LcrH family type III secretion system chaperone [Chromobacterium vaccinii]MCD4500987.1 SycD/LcrH family type III secretion system chaperone [Chromobacterium vaccinii]QND86233.1 Type III secretion system low calcium response chaperone LcrH/SycD [Chromobacterium vaccinii]QND91464.1 Type III secretion system low calcium response chaperone LcrH/SycD [Chromobacterium vaccinii]SUX56092.1 pathogenicity